MLRLLAARVMVTADITTNFTTALEDPTFRNGIIHKLTVVAHQQYGALIAVNQLFKQFQRFDVKIVRWFIEN